ncbi:MAG: hypothetical protein IJ035_03270 [Oscillospiraceae bacterium]|nr:hypothetical protein [Oscillospiraceae bacterium]
MKRILSLFTAIVVALSLSGCKAEYTENQTAEATVQTEKDYSDYEEFLEGWSAERVLNMISIDGYQLSFPCTVDDILVLSDDFKIKHKRYKAENQEFTGLYYKDTQIANICYYDNGYMCYIKLYDTF